MDSSSSSSLDTLAAMRWQEQTGYMKSDWVAAASSANGPLHLDETVDVDCRNKMAAWSMQVIDFLKFSRETVEIALNYLDRYMATPAGVAAMSDRNEFQLAAMTALYTAVKIHEPTAMDPTLVSNLSNGAFTASDIEAQESHLLRALKWRVNPPTSMAFCRLLLDLIPEESLNTSLRQAVLDLCKLQTELAVCNYSLVTVQSSTVAYCALMNALESFGVQTTILEYVGYNLAQALEIDCNSAMVCDVQDILYESVDQQQPVAMTRNSNTTQRQQQQQVKQSSSMSVEVSPRSISC